MSFVVESVARTPDGQKFGTFRVYVPTEQRAREIAEAFPGRTWRAVDIDTIPAAARENLLRIGA